MSDRTAAYEIEPKNKFAEATRAIVEYEIRPGNTVSFVAEIDLTDVERVRDASNGRKPSYTAFVVKAVALALRDFPYANRRVTRLPWLPFLGARLQKFHGCDVAVAVERDFPGSESTAFIDIVRDADRSSLDQITEALRELAHCDASTNKQWREFSGVITRLPVWLATFLIRLPCSVPGLWVKWRGGAALISSPAKYGVDVVLGSWSHPLGVSFGLVKPRPVVVDGAIVARPTFALTLNFDRRVMAGAQAARFFRRVVERLERAGSEMSPYLSPPAGGPSDREAVAVTDAAQAER
jgi:pyruvate/2-oxoglutarate dehydrogenase complex dihydrolipoamide acyltransferase (E2) component